MDDQILSLEHISLSYHTMKGETPALCDLTFSVTPGEFVALVGPSGCGKQEHAAAAPTAWQTADRFLLR